jgi:hypothetical protein
LNGAVDVHSAGEEQGTGLVVDFAVGAEHFADELVVGAVGLDEGADEFVEGIAGRESDGFVVAGDAEFVEKEEGDLVGVGVGI